MTDKVSIEDFRGARLNKKDSFCFSCHKDVACFNECCKDVNIILTPLDIVRLKNHLKITSDEFLDKYTIQPFNKEQKLPVVLLRMDEAKNKKCHFVTKEGCSVYEDRPWACRMFPLGVAIPKAGTKEKEFYFVLPEEINENTTCLGLKEQKKWGINEWIVNQGIVDYDKIGEQFKEVSLHNYLLEGNELGPQKMEMFHTVCYNIDKFRRLIFKTGDFFNLFEISENEKAQLGMSDEALLLFGFRWLRFSLFGEKIFKMTKQAEARVTEKLKALTKEKEKEKQN